MPTTKINTFPFNKQSNNLVFFDKEGNFINTEEINSTYSSKLYFDENSSDTFKTLGLNIFEWVEGFEYSQFNEHEDEIFLQKFQLYNSNKTIFSGFENRKEIDIEDIRPTDSKNTTFGKWLYSPNIDSFFKVGDRIMFENNVYSFVNNKVYSIVGLKKNAILVLSTLNNRDYILDYPTYQAPTLRLKTVNIISIYDYITKDYRPKAESFSEPFFYSKLYKGRSLNVVSEKNEGIYNITNTKINDSIYKHYDIDINILNDDYSFLIENKKGSKLIYSGNIEIDNNFIKTDTPALRLLRGGNIISFDGNSYRVSPITEIDIFNPFSFNQGDVRLYQGLVYKCINSYNYDPTNPILPTDINFWQLTDKLPLIGSTPNITFNGDLFLENNIISIDWQYQNDLSIRENTYLFLQTQVESFYQLGINISLDRREDRVVFESIYPDDYIDLTLFVNNIDQNIKSDEIYQRNIEVDNSLTYEIVDKITKQKECNILVNNLDDFGLDVIINEIIYRVDFTNNIQTTLRNFVDLYKDILKTKGFLISSESFNSPQQNILKITTIYPDTPLIVSKNSSSTSDVVFIDKIINFDSDLPHGNTLNILINNRNFSSQLQSNAVSSINKWIKQHEFILNQFGLKPMRVGKTLIINKENYNNKNNFQINIPGIKASQSGFVLIDKDPIYDGFVISSNMILQNNEDINLIDEKFSTSQVITVNNSVFNPNNTSYKIINITPNELTLSYQGSFFSSDPDLELTNAFFTPAFSDDVEIGDVIKLDDGKEVEVVNISQRYYTVFASDINLFFRVQRNEAFGIGSGDFVSGGVITNVPTVDSFDIGISAANVSVNELDGSLFGFNQTESFLIFTNNKVVSVDKLDGDNNYNFDDKFIVLSINDDKLELIDKTSNTVISSLTLTIGIEKAILLENSIFVLGQDNILREYSKDNFSSPINTEEDIEDFFIDYVLNRVYVFNDDNEIRLFNSNIIANINQGSTDFNILQNSNIVYRDGADTKILDISLGTTTIINNQTGKIYVDNRKLIMVIGQAIYNQNGDLLFNFNGSVYSYNDFYFEVIGQEVIVYNLYFEQIDLIDLETNIESLHFYNQTMFVKSGNIIFTVKLLNIFITNLSIDQEVNLLIEALPFIRYPRKNLNQLNNPNANLRFSIEDNNEEIFIFDNTEDNLTKVENKGFNYEFVDSDIVDLVPHGMQINMGFNSKQEGVTEATLVGYLSEDTTVTYLENMKFEDIDGRIGIIKLDSQSTDTFKYQIESNTINDILIEKGAIFNIRVLNGDDDELENDNINIRILSVKTRQLEVEYLDGTSFVSKEYQGNKIIFKRKPNKLVEILLKGQTEIEDLRYKIELDNTGKTINPDDIYIFQEYPIKEGGIDWKFLNAKRKELISTKNEIFNYIGSYRSLINSINYFGYNNLELYEYFQNLDPETNNYLDLIKVEIPDIFTNPTWERRAYNSWDFPNDTYKGTKLFNLTYRFTDFEGNSIITYSQEEALIKLQGLKTWLKKNIVPITHDILDITGRSDFRNSFVTYHSGYKSKIFNLNDKIHAFDFFINEIYALPVNNTSTQYNACIEFSHSDIENAPDFYTITVKTYQTHKQWDPFVDYSFGEKITYLGKLYENVLIDKGALSLNQNPEDVKNKNINPRLYSESDDFSLLNAYREKDITKYKKRFFRFTKPLVKPRYRLIENENINCLPFSDGINDGDDLLRDLREIFRGNQVNYVDVSLSNTIIEQLVDVVYAIQENNINLCNLFEKDENEILLIRNFLFNEYATYTYVQDSDLNISLSGLIGQPIDNLQDLEYLIRVFIDTYNQINNNYFMKFSNLSPIENIELNKEGFVLWEEITAWKEVRLQPVQTIVEKRAHGDRLKDYHFSLDSSIDPYVMIDVNYSNGYGSTKLDRKAYEVRFDADGVNFLEV